MDGGGGCGGAAGVVVAAGALVVSLCVSSIDSARGTCLTATSSATKAMAVVRGVLPRP